MIFRLYYSTTHHARGMGSTGSGEVPSHGMCHYVMGGLWHASHWQQYTLVGTQSRFKVYREFHVKSSVSYLISIEDIPEEEDWYDA